MSRKSRIIPEEALACHFEPSPESYAAEPSTPMAAPRDPSRPWSPGVSGPVEAIAKYPGDIDSVMVNHGALASFSVKWLQKGFEARAIGPILTGTPGTLQILSTGAIADDILNRAAIAARRRGAKKQ